MSQKGERTVPGTNSITLGEARNESNKFIKSDIINFYRKIGKSLRYSGKKRIFYVSNLNSMVKGILISNLIAK